MQPAFPLYNEKRIFVVSAPCTHFPTVMLGMSDQTRLAQQNAVKKFGENIKTVLSDNSWECLKGYKIKITLEMFVK